MIKKPTSEGRPVRWCIILSGKIKLIKDPDTE